MPTTNLPPTLQSVSVFLCEKVLQEKDEVLTFIRSVEIFNVAIIPDIPIDRQGPTMIAVVIGKLQPNDLSEHSVQLQLIRPGGETKLIGDEHRDVFVANLPDYPGGFTFAQQMAISPKEMGLHYMAVLFDGKEVARTPFMLRPAATSAA